jgi:hypothetical protein
LTARTFSARGSILPPERNHYARIRGAETGMGKRRGLGRLARYVDNRQYFYGEETEPDDVRMPLRIRYVPTIVQKHAHYLWGQWETDIVDWVATQALAGPGEGGSDDETAAKIAKCAYHLVRRADANDKLFKGALDAGIYGDGVFRLRYDRELMGAGFDVVLPEYYHALWSPLDVNKTLETCLAYNMDRQTTYAEWGTFGNPRSISENALLHPGMATVWEWWNPWEWMLVVDDVVVQHNPNPYAEPARAAADGVTTLRPPGFLPFVHVPNLGINGEYWGVGDSEAIHALQDELNLRLADMGDTINYHSHPITVLQNYWGKVKELLVAPDALWDLGREGKASYLQWSGPPPAIYEYIEMVVRIMLETTNLTPTCFGRSEQSQASGQSLQMTMLPVTEIVRRKRSQWGPRLRRFIDRLIRIEFYALGEGRFTARYGFTLADLARFELGPRFAPILPRDRIAVVNEVTQRIVNKTISLLGALELLGEDDPKTEKDRIFEDLKELARLQVEQQASLAAAGLGPGAKPEMPNRDGGKNSDRAKGGSNTEPNPEDR